MTYPAPPPELPPQTAPAPQVVQAPAPPVPTAVTQSVPAAPAPLRQVIRQLPPATAKDLGRPTGVVDLSTVRDVVKGTAPATPRPVAPRAMTSGPAASGATISGAVSSGDRPPLATPAVTSQQLNGDQGAPSLPPLSHPTAPVSRASSQSSSITPSTQPNTAPAGNLTGQSAGDGNGDRSPSPRRVLSGRSRQPFRPRPVVSRSTVSRSLGSPRGTATSEPVIEAEEEAPQTAQIINPNSPNSPFNPEPLNPVDNPITPALPPSNWIPGTKADDEDPEQPNPTEPLEPAIEPELSAEPEAAETTPTPGTTNSNIQRLDLPTNLAGAVEVTADQQEYDEIRNVVIATGNAVVRFQGAVISGDRVQLNLNNRIALAEGQVGFKRGQQLLRGNRLEYNLVQGDGILLNGYGEVDRSTIAQDLGNAPPVAGTNNPALDRPLSDRITSSDPLNDVRQVGQFALEAGTGNIGIVDAPPGQTGEVQRFRFQADRIEFDPNGWVADNARLTNDPFSPPELEIRTPRLRFRRLSPLRDELVAEKGRWVIDDSFSLPLFPSRTVFDRREQPPEPFNVGFDEEDRGGVFLERMFRFQTPQWRLDVTPQFNVQQALTEGNVLSPEAWGAKARLVGNVTPKLSVLGAAQFTSFDFDEFDDRFRGSLRANQIIDTPWGPHTLTAEYSFRDRLFNGTFGFQTIRRSLGLVFTSPAIPLGQTKATLQYQGGVQNITARTDRPFLLKPIRDNDLITLDRIQLGAILRRNFTLWRGEPLPATADQGLRYTPVPVRPSLRLVTRLRAFSSNYSNGEFQNTVAATVGIQGQFGHFSRPWFDYTAFNLAYQQRWRNGESPFLFDRVGENSVVGFGLTQQLYGPFRVGFQGAYSIDREELLDSSFTLDYSRRTFGITLRFNPERQRGSILFRLTDFNWSGSGRLFDDKFDNEDDQ